MTLTPGGLHLPSAPQMPHITVPRQTRGWPSGPWEEPGVTDHRLLLFNPWHFRRVELRSWNLAEPCLSSQRGMVGKQLQYENPSAGLHSLSRHSVWTECLLGARPCVPRDIRPLALLMDLFSDVQGTSVLDGLVFPSPRLPQLGLLPRLCLTILSHSFSLLPPWTQDWPPPSSQPFQLDLSSTPISTGQSLRRPPASTPMSFALNAGSTAFAGCPIPRLVPRSVATSCCCC